MIFRFSSSSLRVALLVVVLTVLVAVVAGCGGTRGRNADTSGPDLVEGGVLFRFYDTEAERVYLVGDFNNWVVRADPMVDRNGDGEWTIVLNLKPGRYEYKFVINGVNWIHDPRNGDTVPDGFEGRNSVVEVPGS